MNQGTLIVKPLTAKLTYDTEWFGRMDPYVRITLGGTIQKSGVAKDQGKNPNWNDTLTFRANGEQQMKIELYDKDDISKDDFIAEAMIPLFNVYSQRTVNNWFPVTRKGRSAGQVMLILEFYPDGGAGGMAMGGGFGMGYGQPQFQQPGMIPTPGMNMGMGQMGYGAPMGQMGYGQPATGGYQNPMGGMPYGQASMGMGAMGGVGMQFGQLGNAPQPGYGGMGGYGGAPMGGGYGLPPGFGQNNPW